VTPSDVRVASRLLNRQLLDSLAQPVEAHGKWPDLVGSQMTLDRLAELQQRCVMRERLAGEVGQAFQSSVGRGVRALFAGASGTGKTMAARILAAELGMDLYRVDLAAVVNKYVGETEKNLHLVLSRAEALDVVLLLDEGDALMGKRSEVRSSNDRYANLETNYLLQRLESYQGVVIVTTNFAENIDPAFQRRMDVVTPFFTPRPDERRRIWELHLPAAHRIDPEWFERVVQRCGLTGGQIRNAVLQAASLALDGRRALDQTHLHVALLREYQKAGASFPLLGGAGRQNRAKSNLSSFVSALRAR
jgi:SpoVK/Ycf46/Vps4 family AAA+-type ATPase